MNENNLHFQCKGKFMYFYFNLFIENVQINYIYDIFSTLD